jgi:hypothetical protein
VRVSRERTVERRPGESPSRSIGRRRSRPIWRTPRPARISPRGKEQEPSWRPASDRSSHPPMPSSRIAPKTSATQPPAASPHGRNGEARFANRGLPLTPSTGHSLSSRTGRNRLHCCAAVRGVTTSPTAHANRAGRPNAGGRPNNGSATGDRNCTRCRNRRSRDASRRRNGSPAERPASPHAAAVIVDPGGEVGFADRAADADAQSMACARCGMSDPAATMAIAAAIVTRILRILISFIRFQFARNSGEPIMKVIVAQRR